MTNYYRIKAMSIDEMADVGGNVKCGASESGT